MPVNYFIGKSRAWLEEELAKCQTDLARSKSVSSYSSGDVSVGKRVEDDLEKRYRRLVYSLSFFDPVTYPASSIARVSRTQIRVYTADPE